MSTTRKPLPPEIYMRRRMAALVIILVLVVSLIGMWAAFSGGEESGKQDVPYPEMGTPTAVAPAQEKDQGASTKAAAEAGLETTDLETTVVETTVTQAAADPTPSGQPAPADTPRKDTCELNDLVLTASVDKPTYQAGEQPQMTVSVDNPTAADCTVNLDELTLRFEVYDMGTNQLVWNDTDCSLPVKTGVQTFQPQRKREFTATWSRLGSTPGACESRQPVAPGAYFLHAVIGQHASEPQPFNLY